MIDINRVYQTVQRILNVEQRGQLPPTDFNYFANLAQLDMFNKLMADKAHFDLSQKMLSQEFAERIEIFNVQESIDVVNDVAELSNDVYKIHEVYLQPIIETTVTNITVPGEVPTISDNVAFITNAGVSGTTALASGFTRAGNPVDAGTWTGTGFPVESGSFTFKTDQPYWLVPQNTWDAVSAIRITGYVTASQTFSYGGSIAENTEYFVFAGTEVIEETEDVTTATNGPLGNLIEKVDHKGLRYLLQSSLTKPSQLFPKYTRNQSATGVSNLSIFPKDIGTERITIEYIKIPTEPVWGFRTINGTGLYDSTISTNFQLHPAMEDELIKKVLFYAGVSIREENISQLAQADSAADNATEKQ